MPRIPNIELEDFDSLFGGFSKEEEDFFHYGVSKPKSAYPVQEIPLEEMHSFKDHPFKVRDDEKMQALMESISEYGVLHPGLVRPDPQGGYEIISGHRRHMACRKLKYRTMPVRVLDLDDDSAVLCMTDANFQQRDSMLISEKAKAYRMKYEAIKHKRSEEGGRNIEKMGKEFGESPKTFQRYLRVAMLSEELLTLIDNKKLGFVQGVNLSYLDEVSQKMVADKICELHLTLNQEQSKAIKEAYKDGSFDEETLLAILIKAKKDQRKVYLKDSFLRKYFPEDISEKEIEKILIQAMECYRAGD